MIKEIARQLSESLFPEELQNYYLRKLEFCSVEIRQHFKRRLSKFTDLLDSNLRTEIANFPLWHDAGFLQIFQLDSGDEVKAITKYFDDFRSLPRNKATQAILSLIYSLAAIVDEPRPSSPNNIRFDFEKWALAIETAKQTELEFIVT